MISIFVDVDNTLIPKNVFTSFIKNNLYCDIDELLKKPDLFDYVFIKLYNTVSINDNILFVINDIMKAMYMQCQFFLISKKYSTVSVQALHDLTSRLRKYIVCYPIVDIIRNYTVKYFVNENDIIIHDYDDDFNFDESRIIGVNNDKLIINKTVIPLEYDDQEYSMYKITELKSKIELAKNLSKLIEIGE